ncbi:hypothetical protein PIB30_011492 [Stylosanthes scabra]|uniref:Uncharacterized protein n=1 Tax=Stylosanthes scabra TaxID=79078 RepID=A0ABU6S6A0_9FABA|nr:hypothetical protein [Stylosanthes scabra]
MVSSAKVPHPSILFIKKIDVECQIDLKLISNALESKFLKNTFALKEQQQQHIRDSRFTDAGLAEREACALQSSDADWLARQHSESTRRQRSLAAAAPASEVRETYRK